MRTNDSGKSDQNTTGLKASVNISAKTTDSLASNLTKNEPTTDQENPSSSYPYLLSPSTIPGVLNAQNFGSIDWSLNGMLAYGCQNRVIIVDTKPSLLFRQSLHRHKQTVCLVKWSPLTNHLCLCSIDTIGMIIVWDVIESTPLTVILSTNENKSVSFFHWIYLDRKSKVEDPKQKSKQPISCWDLQSFNNNKSSKDDETTAPDNVSTCLATNLFLLTFYHHTNTIIVYDADLGEPVTKWQIQYSVSNVLFNPYFQFNRCCDSSVSNLLFTFKTSTKDHFHHPDRIYFGLARLDEHFLNNSDHTTKEPTTIQLPLNVFMIQKEKNGHRFDLIQRLDQSQHSNHLLSVNDHINSPTNDSQSTSTATNNSNNDQQLIQIEFHKSVRNQILLVFSREIYLIDLSLEIIITIIPIERNFSKLVRIFSCSLRNAFYALHENGNVSFRLYQKKVIQDNLPVNTETEYLTDQHSSFLNIGYVNLCHSDPIRLTKQNKIYAYALSPFDQTKIAFLLSTGRIIFKSLIRQNGIMKSRQEPCISARTTMLCLDDLIKPKEYKLGAFLVQSNDDYLDNNGLKSIDDNGDKNDEKSLDSITYKLIITHYLSGLNNLPTVIKMCPPLTLQNIHQHKPLLAVGDTLGIVQIWLLDNHSSTLHREFCCHSYAIAGIEWANLHSLITFSYPSINSPAHNYTKHPLSALQSTLTGSGQSSGKVTNELIHIDIETGKLTPFRTNHITDNSPIETIRVSHLKQYLIILFKRDDPFEIWDVKTLTLLRVMSKSIGFVTAVEWNPLYNRKQVAAKNLDQTSDSDTGSISSNSAGGGKSSLHHGAIKENFIVTSKELFHFSIEGNIIRELARIPADVEGGHMTVTSIAWKSDQVLFGDASGTLNLWDLKRKQSRTEPTYRSAIKKVRFGPGRGNMKCLILYSDFGVDIWDINDFRLCSQLKYPRDVNFKIIDVDWASCDLPIFATSDGFVFVTDQKLKTYSSPLNMERLTKSQNFSRFFNDHGDCDQNHHLLHDSDEKQAFLSFLEDLNVNFLSFKMRKRLIRKFMFEIPLKIQNTICNEGCADDEEVEVEEDREICAIQSSIDNDHQNGLLVDLQCYIDNQKLLAKLFCNQNDYDFWSLVSSIFLSEELDTRMDLFLDNQQFRNLQQEKLMILEHGRRTYFHACQVYKLNLNLKNFQRAVQVLLESESSIQAGGGRSSISQLDASESMLQNSRAHSTFYVDALKACLIAALQTNHGENGVKKDQRTVADDFSLNDNLSLTDNDDTISMNQTTTGTGANDQSDSSNSTSAVLNETKVAPVVKLVATSLIANGHIDEGVELLTIISKTSDACRYLQSSDQWLDSIWLAKSTLDGNECTEVMRRWCEYLISSKRYSDRQTAMKVYLSRKQFSRILRSLNQYFESKTFPLAVVIIGAQLIDLEANMDCLEDVFQKFVHYFYNINDPNQLMAKFRDHCKDGSDKMSADQEKESGNQNLEILHKCWKLFFQQSTK